MPAESMVVHLVVPQLLDDFPDELKRAVQLRRELFLTGTCTACNRTLPTAEQMERFTASIQSIEHDPTAMAARQGVLGVYFDHADFCRGAADRMRAIGKRNGVVAGAFRHEIVSFDLATRTLTAVTPIPDDMPLQDVLTEYRRLVEGGE